MTYILFTIFLTLLPFCPLWVGVYRPTEDTMFIYHSTLYEFIFYNVKLKKEKEKVKILSYSFVKEKYKELSGV